MVWVPSPFQRARTPSARTVFSVPCTMPVKSVGRDCIRTLMVSKGCPTKQQLAAPMKEAATSLAVSRQEKTLSAIAIVNKRNVYLEQSEEVG